MTQPHKADEPSFTLWASDPAAVNMVREWAANGIRALQLAMQTTGKACTPDDLKLYVDAYALANAMDAWQRSNPT